MKNTTKTGIPILSNGSASVLRLLVGPVFMYTLRVGEETSPWKN